MSRQQNYEGDFIVSGNSAHHQRYGSTVVFHETHNADASDASDDACDACDDALSHDQPRLKTPLMQQIEQTKW